MNKYKHIYFDLDLTLWDFDFNSAATLIEILDEFKLKQKISETEKFISLYKIYNEYVWELYRTKKITKEMLRRERFQLLFSDFGIHDEILINEIQEYYVRSAPKKQQLMEGARDILEYLYPKYSLYIVSNGFLEVQQAKMDNSDITRYFSKIFTSDKLGCAKPDKRIFEYCVKSVNATKKECLFIGDDIINDVEGPMKFGIDQVFYNPKSKSTQIIPTYEIKELVELKEFL